MRNDSDNDSVFVAGDRCRVDDGFWSDYEATVVVGPDAHGSYAVNLAGGFVVVAGKDLVLLPPPVLEEWRNLYLAGTASFPEVGVGGRCLSRGDVDGIVERDRLGVLHTCSDGSVEVLTDV